MTRLTLTLLQAALLGLVINIRVQAQVNEKDSLALVALYHATGGTKWSDNTNWLAGEPANWVGVEVTDDRVNVLKLSFRDNKLTGAIPTELGNLTKLTALNLSFNPLSGSLPLSLTNLKNLTFFDFSETFLCEPSNPTFQVLTPITSPSSVNSGPPLLPALMAASLCTYATPAMRRLALTMPRVTVPSNPRGLPTAITSSPTSTSPSAKIRYRPS